MRESKARAGPTRWWIGAAGMALVAGGAYWVSSRQLPQSVPFEPILSALENSRRMADAERVRRACEGGALRSCACRQEAAHRALDRNLHAEAQAVLLGDAECDQQPTTRGLLAEVLARSERSDDAIAKANETLGADPNQRFATYALAHAGYAKGEIARAADEARRAIERGRGAPAHLLLGLIAYRAGNLAAARAEFEQMLVDNAEDVDALYNLAVIAGRQNRYRDAREGYLNVLELDPGHLDARYNLGLLTHSVGASAEAEHHLQKLEAIAPSDDHRVANLRAVLATRPQADAPAAR
jgi:tetratricopeptide (TPR) repeat protein